MTNFDNSKIYNKYCSEVLDGEIVAGEWMIKACQRYRDWFDREDLYFNYEDVDRKIRVIQRFKLQEGGYFILQPFQQFIIAGIFGFYYVDEPDIRVISNVLILTARKSGKSTFASALALVHILTDKQPSPEVAFIANTAKQAGNLFKYCKRLASSVDPKQKIFR